ncbi:hypothetical protein Tco_0046838 [Tanacetum coccineum]
MSSPDHLCHLEDAILLIFPNYVPRASLDYCPCSKGKLTLVFLIYLELSAVHRPCVILDAPYMKVLQAFYLKNHNPASNYQIPHLNLAELLSSRRLLSPDKISSFYPCSNFKILRFGEQLLNVQYRSVYEDQSWISLNQPRSNPIERIGILKMESKAVEKETYNYSTDFELWKRTSASSYSDFQTQREQK